MPPKNPLPFLGLSSPSAQMGGLDIPALNLPPSSEGKPRPKVVQCAAFPTQQLLPLQIYLGASVPQLPAPLRFSFLALHRPEKSSGSHAPAR